MKKKVDEVKESKQKKMTVKEIEKRLQIQVELDKRLLEQAIHSLPSLDTLKDVEVARTRIYFCKDLLKEITLNRKGKR